MGDIINIKDRNRDYFERLERDFILENARIGIRRAGTGKEGELCETLREMASLEAYLYIPMEYKENESVRIYKMTKEMAIKKHLTMGMLQSYALVNTIVSTITDNVGDYLAEQTGEDKGFVPMYIVTNEERFLGASAILDKITLHEIAKAYEVDSLFVMPASIHEMIVMPCDYGMTLDRASQMVANVNRSTVSEKERLADNAFIIKA